ncbi:unnamed protein product [Schistosoma margrebowiei]|uniref:Uncharacterized protein n=1 Tax=Schistosoma margrebowiei TaxID=48269 RepID=A0A183M5W8_9TREM|nr:unnamed protein product [Schistosoma margrebowiei]
MLLYSGHEDGNTPCTRRVALMLSKVTRNALVGWESYGSKIIKASFKIKKEGITINVIQCYAPNNYIDLDDKDQSYESLKSVLGIIFTHKSIHKATWMSPNHITENQKDHICINRKFRRTMEDLRSRRRADIASDHYELVVAKTNLSLKEHWATGGTALQRISTAILPHIDKLNEFKITLNNRFQALQDLL